MNGKLTGIVLICLLAIPAAVYSANVYLAGSIPSALHRNPEDIEKNVHYLEALLTSTDQLVSMLVTIQISIFVIAGFALNTQVRESKLPSNTTIIFGGLFVIAALMSLTLGYTARIQASALIQWGELNFESVRKSATNELICVVASAVAAVCMMIASLFGNGPGELLRNQPAKPPAPSAPKPPEPLASKAAGTAQAKVGQAREQSSGEPQGSRKLRRKVRYRLRNRSD